MCRCDACGRLLEDKIVKLGNFEFCNSCINDVEGEVSRYAKNTSAPIGTDAFKRFIMAVYAAMAEHAATKLNNENAVKNTESAGFGNC